MKNLRFEYVDNRIHIIDYPAADKVLELPDTQITKRLKDMFLHRSDLHYSIEFMQSIHVSNSQIISKALVHSAIISYYKCFGQNDFRNNSLIKKKVLTGLPKEASDVFDYYKSIRDKFIAHDASRYAQVYTGAIIESSNPKPFVDIMATAFIANIPDIKMDTLQSLFNLLSVTLEWVENEINKIMNVLIAEFSQYDITQFKQLNEIIYTVPTDNDWDKPRY